MKKLRNEEMKNAGVERKSSATEESEGRDEK